MLEYRRNPYSYTRLEKAKRIFYPRPTFSLPDIPKETPRLWYLEKQMVNNVFWYMEELYWSERDIPELLKGRLGLPNANPQSLQRLRQANHGQANDRFDETVSALLDHNLDRHLEKPLQGKYIRWVYATAAYSLARSLYGNKDFMLIGYEADSTRLRMLRQGLKESSEIEGNEVNNTILTSFINAAKIKPISQRVQIEKEVLAKYIENPY